MCRRQLDGGRSLSPDCDHARIDPGGIARPDRHGGNADAIERSALPGRARRLSLFYCDPGQSQQKGGCERNHVDLRKLLPKGRGISFDALERADTAVVMSQLNSEPRPSLGGLSPIRMLLAARGADGAALLDLLGIEEIPYEGLDLTPNAVSRARAERGLGPLS